MLLGVIPGLHEPKKHVNTFLTPIVEELQQLWEGIILQNCHGDSVIVRGALICVACDIGSNGKI